MPDFVGMFHSPEPGAIIPKTNDVSVMTFAVSEVASRTKVGTVSNAIVAIGNVDIAEGTITTVIIEHKLPAEADTAYTKISTFAVEWIGDDNTENFIVPNISWKEAGIDHDFRAYFQNSDGELAVQTSDGEQIGVATPTGAGWLEDVDVTFNGYDDLSEYPGVVDLVAPNASNTEGGTWASPANIPSNGIIRLEWKDMRKHICEVGNGTCEGNHKLADGTTTSTITESEWANADSYVPYLYIGDTAAPAEEYPDPAEPNGTWYKLPETYNTYCEVDLPKDKIVALYVAVILRLSGSSTTDTITALSYTQY